LTNQENLVPSILPVMATLLHDELLDLLQQARARVRLIEFTEMEKLHKQFIAVLPDSRLELHYSVKTESDARKPKRDENKFVPVTSQAATALQKQERQRVRLEWTRPHKLRTLYVNGEDKEIWIKKRLSGQFQSKWVSAFSPKDAPKAHVFEWFAARRAQLCSEREPLSHAVMCMRGITEHYLKTSHEISFEPVKAPFKASDVRIINGIRIFCQKVADLESRIVKLVKQAREDLRPSCIVAPIVQRVQVYLPYVLWEYSQGKRRTSATPPSWKELRRLGISKPHRALIREYKVALEELLTERKTIMEQITRMRSRFYKARAVPLPEPGKPPEGKVVKTVQGSWLLPPKPKQRESLKALNVQITPTMNRREAQNNIFKAAVAKRIREQKKKKQEADEARKAKRQNGDTHRPLLDPELTYPIESDTPLTPAAAQADPDVVLMKNTRATNERSNS